MKDLWLGNSTLSLTTTQKSEYVKNFNILYTHLRFLAIG